MELEPSLLIALTSTAMERGRQDHCHMDDFPDELRKNLWCLMRLCPNFYREKGRGRGEGDYREGSTLWWMFQFPQYNNNLVVHELHSTVSRMHGLITFLYIQHLIEETDD